MTNEELCKALRKPWFTNGCEKYQLEAADQIEALVKERGEWHILWREALTAGYAMKDRAEAAEAKLAKAVEALGIARVHVANNEQGWSVSRGAARDDLTLVDATLAEIKGESHE